jgi:hypothetical protein
MFSVFGLLSMIDVFVYKSMILNGTDGLKASLLIALMNKLQKKKLNSTVTKLSWLFQMFP